MTKAKTVLTIDRSKWGRGTTGGSLLDSNTKLMCCLGFACIQSGFKPNQIMNESLPAVPANEHPKSKVTANLKAKFGFLLDDREVTYFNSSVAEKLADVNDNPHSSDTTKEKRITKLFAKHGVTVKFVDPKPKRKTSKKRPAA